jgi:hypothetical protein
MADLQHLPDLSNPYHRTTQHSRRMVSRCPGKGLTGVLCRSSAEVVGSLPASHAPHST